MKPTEQEKLQFGIEIVAAMFAERLHNGDLDAGMIDALSETEIDRLGYSKDDIDAMPPDRLEMITKMTSFHKTRLHQQAMFMANTVLSSGFISQMQHDWVEINSIDDLPTKEGKYFTYCVVDWHPFYRIDTFHGRLSNAVHHITGKPIFTHYMEMTLPQPPTTK